MGSLPARAPALLLLTAPPPINCSVRTFGRLRDEMVYAAIRCRRPKWLVLVSLMWGRQWTEEELFYPPDEVRVCALGPPLWR